MRILIEGHEQGWVEYLLFPPEKAMRDGKGGAGYI